MTAFQCHTLFSRRIIYGRRCYTPPLKGDIYPLDEPLTTENEPVENRKTEYKDLSPDTLDKLKPCLELLEGIINSGQEVIKEILAQLLVNMVGQKIAFLAQQQLLDWLVKSRKLMTI